MIIKVRRIPAAGGTILGGEFASAAGGKGANQAVGAARAGGAVTFIARVGQDMFGEKAVAGFISEGVNVDYIISDRNSPSGVALIFVGQKGQNSIAVASGANGKLAPSRKEIEALLATGKIRRMAQHSNLFRRNGDAPHFEFTGKNRNGAKDPR